MNVERYEQINVPCEGGEDFVIPCWPVKVAPHLEGEFSFVAHKSVDCFDSWHVAERTTGMRVPGVDGENLDEAAGQAEAVLKKITPEKMRTTMQKASATLARRKQ